MAIIAIMACGMVFVIVTGGIDLSVGFVPLSSPWLRPPSVFRVIDGHCSRFSRPWPRPGSELITSSSRDSLYGPGLLMGLFQGYIIARLRCRRSSSPGQALHLQVRHSPGDQASRSSSPRTTLQVHCYKAHPSRRRFHPCGARGRCAVRQGFLARSRKLNTELR